MAKKTKRKRLPAERVIVETLVIYRWECPHCGMQHDSEDHVPVGTVLTCTHEGGKQDGCQAEFVSVSSLLPLAGD